MKTFFDPRGALGRYELLLRHGLNFRLRQLIPEQARSLHSLITRIVADRVRLYDIELMMLPEWIFMTVLEVQMWEKYYLPLDHANKIVLDVGAGCGETAAFYLHWGASQVVAIEPDPIALQVLTTNQQKTRLNIKCVPAHFSLEHLKIRHDFLKMDIEGHEKVLLDYDGDLGQCVIEVHDLNLADSLMRKFDLHLILNFPGHSKCLVGKLN